MEHIIVYGLVAVLGIVIGNRVGSEWGSRLARARSFWLANLAVFAGGVLLCFVAPFVRVAAIIPFSIGLVGGCLFGLRFGYGKAEGPWKAHDKFFKLGSYKQASKIQTVAVEDEHKTAQSRKKRSKRELMSVSSPSRKDTNR